MKTPGLICLFLIKQYFFFNLYRLSQSKTLDLTTNLSVYVLLFSLLKQEGPQVDDVKVCNMRLHVSLLICNRFSYKNLFPNRCLVTFVLYVLERVWFCLRINTHWNIWNTILFVSVHTICDKGFCISYYIIYVYMWYI